MAAPFVVLGLKATDKLVDDHFHKLPDKYFHPSTYNPLKSKSRKGSKDSDTGSQDREVKEGDQKEDIPTVEEPKEYDGEVPKMAAYPPPPPPVAADMYSHEPPRVRQEYIPPAAMAAGVGVAGAPYFPPPPTEPSDYSYDPRDNRNSYDRRDSRGDYDRRDSRSDYERRGGRRYEDDYNDDKESYYSAPRRSSRPKAVSRRSNSHPGHGSRGSYDDDNDRSSRYNSGSQHVDRAMERAHRYGLKDELKDTFTDSKKGLAASAIGAVVGGWAASKASVAYDKKNRSEPDPLLTLLGAAIGGLAVNAVVDKFEDEQRDTNDQQDKWNEKFGNKGGSQKGSDQDRGSERGSGRDKRSRGTSRRHDRGYDSGYD